MKLREVKWLVQNYSVSQWFLTGGDFVPKAYLEISEDSFDYLNRGGGAIAECGSPQQIKCCCCKRKRQDVP